MTDDRTFTLGVYAVCLALAGVSSAYNVFLHAPAAVATRPQLTEIGFWTAAFSGRFMAWLFYHEPLAGTGVSVAFWMLMATVTVWLS